MAIRQRIAAQALLDALRDAHEVATFLAGLSSAPARQVIGQVDAFSRHVERAHTALQLMQNHFRARGDTLPQANTRIAGIVAAELDPAPADLGAAYTTARQAGLAALDAYGAAPVTGEWAWNATERRHETATVTFAHAAAFATARDALAVFA